MTYTCRSLFLIVAAASSVSAQSPPTPQKAVNALERVAQARATKKLTERYDPTFKKYTKRYFGPAFDWRLFKAQSFAESNLNPNAKSWVGARGLMQLMPTTFQEIQSARPEFASIDDPEWNIAAGIMHDRYLWDLWKKDVGDEERHRFMFASYNAGEGTISRARAVARTKLGNPAWLSVEQVAPNVTRWRYSETLGYVKRIDSTYARLSTQLITP